MTMYEKIKMLADKYARELTEQISQRIREMESDDNSHYLIYRVLGITDGEGKMIDEYQNKGRFLYQYAGSFLEEAAIMCIQEKYPSSKKKVRIPNTQGRRPRTFEIDCLVDNHAHEIKWRDATTDGDHITKEHTRVKVIKEKGYIPIRIMFYYPNRDQAKRIQETLKTLYAGVGGQYYYSDTSWNYIREFTGIDLHDILQRIAQSRTEKQ